MQLRSWATILSISLVCMVPSSARADQIFDLNATLVNGDIVSGTVNFQNVNVPLYSGSTLTGYQPGMEVDGDNFTIVDSHGNLVGSYDDAFFVGSTLEQPYVELFSQGTESNPSGPFFELAIPGEVPLQYFTGGAICSDSDPCAGVVSASTLLGVSDVGSGSLTAPSAAPEPSSLALLGTGLIGAFGFARRKFVKA